MHVIDIVLTAMQEKRMPFFSQSIAFSHSTTSSTSLPVLMFAS